MKMNDSADGTTHQTSQRRWKHGKLAGFQMLLVHRRIRSSNQSASAKQHWSHPPDVKCSSAPRFQRLQSSGRSGLASRACFHDAPQRRTRRFKVSGNDLILHNDIT
ncbi:uncharacterized protein UV8b_01252 [Ustilaginoidea virens]|uniref:Uncharacterized protein n=1 Tax=Ustilaginoidea virens TaxID=1159556 RepID=A0A8E5ME61_USTVR|nr:uncharacterized protein UV8b_01252 [Ustilaginoidea virens]QUC17011.1 hypothetical protein UV8b_01252 [Ustilaginoidea virens]